MLNLPSATTMERPAPATAPGRACDVLQSDWRGALPVLAADAVMLRELRVSDAPSLLAMLTTEEVSRFISPPPTTVEGFEQFIRWTHQGQAEGRYLCFAIVPAGRTDAVGIIQVRALDAHFTLAEWGFAIGSAFWGTGIFQTAARLALGFAFSQLPIRRLEARAVVENARGNGALKKIGASCDAVLRQSFIRNGERMDQILWSISRESWLFPLRTPSVRVH
jgi:[ribosomal protein S5]-alanine N-acetyltransferase